MRLRAGGQATSHFLRCCVLSEGFFMNDIRESRPTSEIKKPSLRTVGLALLLVVSSVAGGIAYLALAATSTGGTPGGTTLGNQDSHDLHPANREEERNIGFLLQNHLYDAQV